MIIRRHFVKKRIIAARAAGIRVSPNPAALGATVVDVLAGK
jgi:hypothetical protein